MSVDQEGLDAGGARFTITGTPGTAARVFWRHTARAVAGTEAIDDRDHRMNRRQPLAMIDSRAGSTALRAHHP